MVQFDSLIDSAGVIVAVTMTVFVVFKVLFFILGNVWYAIFPFPDTRFGFAGKPVYVDKGRNTQVLVNRSYHLSAKPDFIYKIGLGRYCIVEYKSARRVMSDMDRCQVIASIIAARSRFNVVKAYVATSEGIYPVEEAAKSTSSLYRSIKKNHRIAKAIKHRNKKPAVKSDGDCSKCPKRSCDRRSLH